MFNSKLKQQIAELQIANKNLQQQYNLVYSLLLQRQDEVVALLREITLLKIREPKSKLPPRFYADLKSKIVSIIDNEIGCVKQSYFVRISEQVADYLSEILDPIFYPDSDSDSDSDSEDEDEDEDEDYCDTDFTDPNEDED